MKLNFLVVDPKDKEYNLQEIEFNEENVLKSMENIIGHDEKDLTISYMPSPFHSVISISYVGQIKGNYNVDDLNFMVFNSVPCFGKAVFSFVEFNENNKPIMTDVSDELAKSIFEYLQTTREFITDDVRDMFQNNIDSGEFDKLLNKLYHGDDNNG